MRKGFGGRETGFLGLWVGFLCVGVVGDFGNFWIIFAFGCAGSVRFVVFGVFLLIFVGSFFSEIYVFFLAVFMKIIYTENNWRSLSGIFVGCFGLCFWELFWNGVLGARLFVARLCYFM